MVRWRDILDDVLKIDRRRMEPIDREFVELVSLFTFNPRWNPTVYGVKRLERILAAFGEKVQ